MEAHELQPGGYGFCYKGEDSRHHNLHSLVMPQSLQAAQGRQVAPCVPGTCLPAQEAVAAHFQNENEMEMNCNGQIMMNG